MKLTQSNVTEDLIEGLKENLSGSSYGRLVEFGHGKDVERKEGAIRMMLRSPNFSDENGMKIATEWLTWNVCEMLVFEMRYRIWKRSKISFRKNHGIIEDCEPLKFYFPFKFIEPSVVKDTEDGTIRKPNWWWMKAPFKVSLLDVGNVVKCWWDVKSAIRQEIDNEVNEFLPEYSIWCSVDINIQWNEGIVPRYKISI